MKKGSVTSTHDASQSLGVGAAIRWGLLSLGLLLPFHLGFISSSVWLQAWPAVRAVYGSDWFFQPPKPTGDGPDYEAIGFNIARGRGWTTAYSDPEWRSVYETTTTEDYSVILSREGPQTPETSRPPLLPLILGFLYRCVPRGPTAFAMVRLGLAACLSIAGVIAIVWGCIIAGYWPSDREREHERSLRMNARQFCSPGWIAATMILIVLSERNVCNYATDFLTETIAMVLMMAFLLCAWCGTSTRNNASGISSWAIASGVLFALLYYARGVFVLWIPWLLVWFWLAFEPKVAPKHKLRWIGCFLLVFVVLASPWWIRNCLVLDTFSPLGTKGSTTLLGGYCDESLAAAGEWQFAPEKRLRASVEAQMNLDPHSATASQMLDFEKEVARQARQEVRRWTAENVSRLPSLCLMRIVTEWNPYTGKAMVLKLAALIGMLGLWYVDRRTLLFLAAPLLINTILVAATYSVGGRFLVPTYGAIYLLAAFGILFVLGYVASWFPKRSATA